MIPALLLQSAPPADSMSFDSLLWPSFLALLIVGIIGSLVKRVSVDRCIALLRGHHVTLLPEDRSAAWGDFVARTQGAEVVYDAPHISHEGLVKASMIVYEDELARAVATCRVEIGLTEEERVDRLAQIRRTFQPSAWRRAVRRIRNVFSTIRDAVTKSIGLFVGRMTPRGLAGATFKQHGQDISNRVTELVTNAYEPVLEPHVGRPVILQVQLAKGVMPDTFEMPGYLVDYTAKHVAVFNTEHDAAATIALELPASAADLARACVAIDEEPARLRVRCVGPSACVVVRAEIPGETLHLGVALLPGTSMRLPRWTGSVRLIVQPTRRMDLVCPRSRARVRHAGSGAAPGRRWHGVAPDTDGPA